MGVKELKQNYLITKDARILGTGAYGKVFLTHNKHDIDMKVAIKVMDLKKLKD